MNLNINIYAIIVLVISAIVGFGGGFVASKIYTDENKIIKAKIITKSIALAGLVAALLLIILLYSLNFESRSSELGILLSLGFSKSKILNNRVYESSLAIVIGGIIGVFKQFSTVDEHWVSINYLDENKEYKVLQAGTKKVVTEGTGEHLRTKGFKVIFDEEFQGELFEVSLKVSSKN